MAIIFPSARAANGGKTDGSTRAATAASGSGIVLLLKLGCAALALAILFDPTWRASFAHGWCAARADTPAELAACGPQPDRLWD